MNLTSYNLSQLKPDHQKFYQNLTELIDVGQRQLEVMTLNVETKCYWYFFVSCPRFHPPLLLFCPLPAAHSPIPLPPPLFVACVCICGSNLHTAGTGIKTAFAFQIVLRNRFYFIF